MSRLYRIRGGLWGKLWGLPDECSGLTDSREGIAFAIMWLYWAIKIAYWVLLVGVGLKGLLAVGVVLKSKVPPVIRVVVGFTAICYLGGCVSSVVTDLHKWSYLLTGWSVGFVSKLIVAIVWRRQDKVEIVCYAREKD